ncbi:MAG: AI-2E family transporter [bacterium]|nr:AI-2E family transporter [bacterium]
MVIRLKTVFFIALGLLILWFLYIERAILTPFILAGIFAYIFNPVVNFFSNKIRIPRTISVIIVYIFIMSLVIILSTLLTKRIISESSELNDYMNTIVLATKIQINNLPDFIKPIAEDTLVSLEKSKIFSPVSVFAIFPQAISRIVSFFIFLFAGFYFLKEGRKFIDNILLFIPGNYRIEAEILLRKINIVFGAYLRGQLFLIFIVSLILFAALSVLGVRFALILAIFSGVAEIVPFIGPITAGAVAAFVVSITGNNNFYLSPFTLAAVVAITYFLVRQFQDYFINPFVMGKITNLHPLVVFFAVLAGGHIFGTLGLLLAVPIAATIRIFLEFSLDKINERKAEKPLKTKIS